MNYPDKDEKNEDKLSLNSSVMSMLNFKVHLNTYCR
jgi:hypothetical protein